MKLSDKVNIQKSTLYIYKQATGKRHLKDITYKNITIHEISMISLSSIFYCDDSRPREKLREHKEFPQARHPLSPNAGSSDDTKRKRQAFKWKKILPIQKTPKQTHNQTIKELLQSKKKKVDNPVEKFVFPCDENS